MGYFVPCPPGTSYYHAKKDGFFDPRDKETLIQSIEGRLTYMWQHDIQPKGQHHIFPGIEIGLDEPLDEFEDHYGQTDKEHASSIISPWQAYSKTIIFLDLEKKWHMSVLENLTKAFKEGRLALNTHLQFEIFDDPNMPLSKQACWRKLQKARSMRVHIGNSQTPEPVIYKPQVHYSSGSDLQIMIDTIYKAAKDKKNNE